MLGSNPLSVAQKLWSLANSKPNLCTQINPQPWSLTYLKPGCGFTHKNIPQKQKFSGSVSEGSPRTTHPRGMPIMLQRRHFLQLGAGAITLRTKRSLWIESDSLSDSPSPKFWFGDWVCHEWVCDDELDPDNFGKTLRDYGVVIGLFFSSGSSRYRPGWNYFVSWRWIGGEAVENSNWDDANHESGLKRSNPPVAPRCH